MKKKPRWQIVCTQPRRSLRCISCARSSLSIGLRYQEISISLENVAIVCVASVISVRAWICCTFRQCMFSLLLRGVSRRPLSGSALLLRAGNDAWDYYKGPLQPILCDRPWAVVLKGTTFECNYRSIVGECFCAFSQYIVGLRAREK